MKNLFVTLFVFWSLYSLLAQSKIAPNFVVTDYKGNSIDLYADYLSKDKAVMIQLFFATCPPCNQVASDVQQMYRDNWNSGNDRVEFIGLSTKSWDDDNGVQSFAENNNISFPLVSADGGSVLATQPYTSGRFGLYTGTPTFIVIGPDSIVHFALKLEQVNDTLIEVLKKKDTGGESCPGAFDIDIIYLSNPIVDSSGITIQLESDIQGAKKYPLVRDSSSYLYDCSFDLPPNPDDYYLRPSYDGDATEDVSTRDLVVILRHLLAKKLIQYNATKIAADVNNNGKISTADIAQIRKVILGRWEKFRLVNSHTFYDADDLFEDDTFPYTVPLFRSQIPLNDLQKPEVSGTFNCVKMGDVTTLENRLNDSETRTKKVLNLILRDTMLRKGQQYTIPVAIPNNEKILAFQIAFSSKDQSLAFSSIKYMASSAERFDLNKTNEFVQRMLWFDTEILESHDGNILTLHFVAQADGLLSNQLILRNDRMASLYTDEYEMEGEIQLKFTIPPSSNKHSILFRPNPVSNGRLTVQIPSKLVIENIEIFDISGKLLYKTGINAYKDNYDLNLNHVGLQGVCLVRIHFIDGVTVTNKVIFL